MTRALARDLTARRALLFLGSALAAFPGAALALPGAPINTGVNAGGAVPTLTNPVAGTLDVNLNAARTVLQYGGFTVGAGETVNFRFDRRQDLAVVHSTDGAINIDGVLNGFVGAGTVNGGNVWLLSAAGVFFGAGARVDVGGLLASSSIPSDLLGPNGGINPDSGVLNPATLAFDFSNGAGLVSVAAGARLTGHGGSIALIAPSVRTAAGATIGGAGYTSVLYGAAQRYTVRFAQEAGNDLDLLDFEVPGLTAGSVEAMPLVLAGTTAAGNVYVASVSRADAVRAVLDAQGSIGAVSASAEGGAVVLTSGGGIANREAAVLFTNGLLRQDILAGAIVADRGVSATATGNIALPAPISAGGSIKLRGLNITAASLTAGEDIVVRGGDAVGSTAGDGYGYGYDAEGGQLQVAFAQAGDDVLGTSYDGDTEFGSVVLAGTGSDAAGDPLGELDGANDGRRLRLTTTGPSGDVYLGRDGEFRGGQGSPSFAFETPIDTLVTGTNGIVSLDAVEAVGVVLLGDANLTDVVARGSLATLGATGTLTVGSVTGVGGVGVQANNVVVGSAATSLDRAGNGLIVLNALASASLANADAATDVLVIADNGNATVGRARAGDDVIVRAFGGGIATLNSATVGIGEAPDRNANQFSLGEGSITLFPGLSLDFDGNGRVVDVAATVGAFPTDGGDDGGGDDGDDGGGDGCGNDCQFDQFAVASLVLVGENAIGGVLAPGSVQLGAGDTELGSGTVSGATFVTLVADGDIDISLTGAPRINEAFAGGDIRAVAPAITIDDLAAGGSVLVQADTGDAVVGNAETRLDLSIVAANGLAQVGDARVGQDFLLSGVQVSLGSLGPHSESTGYGYGYGYGETLYPTRDIRIVATAGGFETTSPLAAGRDLTIDVSGDLILTEATAERDLSLGGGFVLVDLARAGRDAFVGATGDLFVGDLTAGDDVRVEGGPTGLLDLGIVRSTGTGEDAGADGSNIFVAGSSISVVSAQAADDIVLEATDTATLGFGGETPTTAGRDIVVTALGIDFGTVSAGRDLILTATDGGIGVGTIGLDSGLSAGRDITLTANTALLIDELAAVRDLTLTGTSIDAGSVGAGRDVTATATGGDLSVGNADAGQDIRLTAIGLLDAGPSRATRDIILAGGLLAVSTLDAGRDLSLTATAGDFGSGGDLAAVRDLTVDANNVTLGSAGAGRDLRLTADDTLTFADLSAGQDIVLAAATVSGGDAGATRDLFVNATVAIDGGIFAAGRDVFIDPDEAITLGTLRAVRNASIVGASIVIGTLEVGGTTLAQATAGGIALDRFTSGGAATLLATGKVDLGDASTAGLRIVGGDLDVRRSLVASNLDVETPGRMIVGGTAAQGETGFRLDAAELARLRVSGIAGFYAGVTTDQGDGQLPGGDLIVQDFNFDPANLPRLAFFADRSHVVDVQGFVAPSDVGGAIQIGDANPNGRFRPSSIFVSGALGTAELIANCFGKVVPANTLSLFTIGDVIFGDSGFRTAVPSTAAGSVDVFAGSPSTPRRTDDRLFAVSTRLIVQAGGKIVSQNTSSIDGAYAGIVLIGTGASGPIIDIGNAAVADLSGSIIDSGGFLRSGPLVARAAELGPGGLNGAIFRFNGCVVGGGICQAGVDEGTPSDALRVEDYQPPRPIDLTDSPLTTVLVADNVSGQGGQLTVVNEAGSIVIRSVIPDGPDAVVPAGPETMSPEVVPGGGCNVVPGSDASKADCPAASGPR